MGSIKDRNGLDLTEAEDIKRWQKYTEELYKKDLHDPDNHDGVITHLESEILQCDCLGREDFFVQFFCVFLPPLLNNFFFCEVHTISVLYRAHPCMKCSLGICNLQPKMEKLYTVGKTRLGADCGSDHELLIAKFSLKLKKVGKTIRPFKVNVKVAQLCLTL